MFVSLLELNVDFKIKKASFLNILIIIPVEVITMGAYCHKRYCAYKSWKQVVKKKQQLVLGPQYRNALHDECLMAVVFGYNAPLLAKILTYSLPSEYEYVVGLFTNKIDIKVRNGNLVISN